MKPPRRRKSPYRKSAENIHRSARSRLRGHIYSSRWGKYSVFQLFPQSSLLLSSSCWSKYSVFQLFPQFSLLLPSARWSKYSFFQLFAPIQSQSCLNPASTKLQINPRLRSDHPRSGLTSASSVYRWIHTLQVQIVQIQLPHR